MVIFLLLLGFQAAAAPGLKALIAVTVDQTANADVASAVKGRVVDENGQPLPGVTVREKGNPKNATVTDVNGRFTITVPADAVLQLSFVGYKTAEVPVQGRTSLDVSLSATATGLNEVVVVGYGTQKKVDLTGSVSTVNSKDLEWKPVGQVSEALQGMIPGLTVTTNSGQPGMDQGTINIRGIGTLNDNSPLVLVDGVRYDEGLSMNDIDANDIASVSVLKDATAASIYGVRAANGVILITTKRGQAGKTQITYNDYFGWQSAARLSKFAGAQEFMKLANQMYENSGSGDVYTQAQINAYNDPNRDPNKYPDNYWLKDILTGDGFQQQHSLSVNGGTDKSTYRFSTNYFDQDGLIQNMNFDRLTMRLNTDFKINDMLTFSADVSGRFSTTHEPQGQSIGGSGLSAWYQFGQGAVINPLTVNKYTNGVWGIVRGGQNPIRLQTEGGQNEYDDNLFTGNFRADLKPIKGLTISGIASGNYDATYDNYRTLTLDYLLPPDFTQVQPVGNNEIQKTYNGYWFQNFQGLAQYEKTLGKHYFKVLVGASDLMENTNYLMGSRLNPPNNELNEIDAGSADGQQTSGNSSAYSLLSYFGRLNYSYNEKYLLEVNLRRDGSSRFAPGQKWGYFPSVSAGWRISSESFLKNVSFIQDLKLRGSWGELGNDAIGNYPYQSQLNLGSYPFGGSLNTTAGLSTYPNNGLTWETTKMVDGGFDLTVLKKLNVTFDYYNKTTDGILLQLRIPETVGLTGSYQNAGRVQNTGWELALNYNDKIGNDFKYSIGGNLSDVRNKILDLKGSDYLTTTNNITTAYKVGEPIGAFYGYIVDGIYQTQAQVNSHANVSSNVGPGDLIYRDINHDGTYTDADKVYLGSNIPRYTYGINFSTSYKGFDLGGLLQGVGKVSINTVVLEGAPTSTDGNFKTAWENSWTPTNTNAPLPRLTTGQQNYQPSSFWVESGAYLRLKSAQLGYTLPADWLKHTFITKLRIYTSGQNLLTFSKLPHDIDPEAPDDNRYYPQVKIFTFGLNANF